ncbi:DUF2788 domain-containing protein [Leeia sp. TBRC 13508]|uniref:DUF2788 domain-containing protein n=1 Tax=Leeia speluncae TaxID=2884804 RepID=A0ABS8D2N9_9NEIS|nr:DUF2788 domain-containing protein [Leeia speluncae]MCB6182451.1 DUF2788 domain-containing protein [Leeia speluncae]
MQISEEVVATLGMQIGLTGLILYMSFIVYDLAKESKAGKYGTIVLFGTLGLGVFGFVLKTILTEILV